MHLQKVLWCHGTLKPKPSYVFFDTDNFVHRLIQNKTDGKLVEYGPGQQVSRNQFFSIILYYGKWFEPRSLSRLCGLIVRVRVVPRRTVVGDIDRRFDNLSGSHHQSHVNCVSSVYGIYVSGQFSRDVIGCFKSNRWLGRDVIGCWFVRSCRYWLWRLIGRR